MSGVLLCIYTMFCECVFKCLVHVLCFGLWFVHVLLILGACLCVCLGGGVDCACAMFCGCVVCDCVLHDLVCVCVVCLVVWCVCVLFIF